MQALAIKYRPHTWADVVEQGSTKVILQNQLDTGEIKHAYLFCGPAGCGKTTCARIFANDINKGQGNPIELDAASNNSVNDVREIIQQAKTKSLDSEYKIFIIDECHALSNSAWQAMLKLIEEPPAKSIFIFCTTDPQKIPKTILSRVQRYDFQRISQKGLVDRLEYILQQEGYKKYEKEALEYIAKLADGGCRDGITYLDKCLAYSSDLTLENVVTALGVADYDTMFKFTENFFDHGNERKILETIDDMYTSGKDLTQFIKTYIKFLLDVEKYGVGCPWEYIQIPQIDTYMNELKEYGEYEYRVCQDLLRVMLTLSSELKYSTSPKTVIECRLLVEYEGIVE